MRDTVTAIDVALSIAVVLTVGLTVLQRSRKAQVMAFLGLGVLLSLVWLRLGNLDVALAEAALGSGILSAVLIILAASPPSRQGPQEQPAIQQQSMPGWISSTVGVSCAAVLTVVIANIWLRAEQQLPHWEEELQLAMSAVPVDHGITGVLLSFRAYDTLLESAVLMFAAVFARAMMPHDSFATMATTPRSFAPAARAQDFYWAFQILIPLLLLLGLWILFAGTTQPGGAFQSGAIIAGLLIMVQLTGGGIEHVIRRWLTPLAVIGVAVFAVSGGLGLAAGATWFTWPGAGAYAVILTIEISLTVGIAIALFMLYLAVSYRAAIPARVQVTEHGDGL